MVAYRHHQGFAVHSGETDVEDMRLRSAAGTIDVVFDGGKAGEEFLFHSLGLVPSFVVFLCSEFGGGTKANDKWDRNSARPKASLLPSSLQ